METKNLVIRETVFEDCEYFARWETDPEITQFLSYDEERSYKDVVEEWVIDKTDPTKLQFTIVRKDIRQPIGRVYISRIDRHCDSLDITKLYIAGEENRQNGFGKEMLKELLEYCFVFLHMERVTLDYYTGNKAAAALYEKLGFQKEGVARNAAKKNGRYYDLHLLSLLRTEFFEKIHDK
ncbi:GNAT family N-acetyltransferase [bacterium 210820-DFI.6.37]|nr:GNAT family N-acetyltransferase [bacterium 210820-DFI.6.37]